MNVASDLKFGHFYFFGPPWRLDGKPQILMWILMWKIGKILVYFEVKVSILII